ncbi:hypothetical protein HCN44_003809 [Aphidius gifuensis]|uniref:Cytidine deaminase n=1 Tax=Aphidius gifuensis TaxID=684658 RepID=A0A835CSI2_APHGI|nr:cytidine deaminase-like [Aphidius gifuensis]KAF7994337.1 hypothetical protein HCN44_003809 [Aphidius gifuensis]
MFNSIEFNTLDQDVQELIRESKNAREMSYSPYSKFKVGAALRCQDGTIVRGCNIENSSYPVGTCAERSALSTAIIEGKKKFIALSVVADCVDNKITSPCGMCRQALFEFGDMPIYLTTPSMEKVFKTSVNELLPLAFHF